MIARVQIKGNAAEVFIDEVDSTLCKETKKWFSNPDWRALHSCGHSEGVIFDKSLRIILLDRGNEFISYKPGGFHEGEYRYSYLFKNPSNPMKTAITAVEYSKGIVFDSGDFECPDNTPWGDFRFEITRVIGFDTEKLEKLDLELITAVYLNKEKYEAGEALPNIAQTEKKKTPKLFADRFDAMTKDFDCSLLKPYWA